MLCWWAKHVWGTDLALQAARRKFWFVILPHRYLCGFCFLLNWYKERHVHLTDGETEALGLWLTFLEVTPKAVELYARYRDESNLVQTLKELPQRWIKPCSDPQRAPTISVISSYLGVTLPYTPTPFRGIWQYLETFLSPLGVGVWQEC